MMNNNSHQYLYPPPSLSVTMNTHSTEKMNGDVLPSEGVPSSSSGGATSGKYYHATTSNNDEATLLHEAASSSIMSSTASIMMMNNNTIVDAQPSMMVPLAYQPSSTAAAGLGFMSNMGGAALSGGLPPSSHHHQLRQQQQQQPQQQPHRNQHHQQQQAQQQQTHVQQTQQAQQQHNSRLTWRNGEKTFPYKVYDMLEYAVTNGFGHVCSWTVVDADNNGLVDEKVKGKGGAAGGEGGGEGGGRGDAFVIHNRELFTETILPKFFVHKNWRSFTRQLNIWCFKRTYTNIYTRGVAKSDCYSHPNFKRNQYDEIGLVTRSESKGAFKKDPLTKRRIEVVNDDRGEITSTAATSSTATTSSVGKEGGTSTINNTSGSNKRRRSQQDMHEVATFLAGLKSNSATTTSDKERNNNDSIEGEGSQLTLSSPGLHAAAYQDAVLELQQQLQEEEEEVECNVDNNAPPLASYSQYCSVEPPPEGTLWTCEKCKVAQFVLFDEAVEHERHCTY